MKYQILKINVYILKTVGYHRSYITENLSISITCSYVIKIENQTFRRDSKIKSCPGVDKVRPEGQFTWRYKLDFVLVGYTECIERRKKKC